MKVLTLPEVNRMFPISRDPPEGGTLSLRTFRPTGLRSFPISRDPPEGGTGEILGVWVGKSLCFQFLGIPPKGERKPPCSVRLVQQVGVSNF